MQLLSGNVSFLMLRLLIGVSADIWQGDARLCDSVKLGGGSLSWSLQLIKRFLTPKATDVMTEPQPSLE